MEKTGIRKTSREGEMRKALFPALAVFFILFYPSCSSRFSRYTYRNWAKLEEPKQKFKLKGEVFIGEEEINLLEDFAIIENYLVLSDQKSRPFLKVFDLRSRRLLISFGKKGQGPAEFTGAPQFIKDPNERGVFWAFDFMARSLKKFRLEKVLRGEFRPEKVVRLKKGRPFSVTVTPEGQILATGYLERGRILVYNMDGELIKRIGKVPVKLKGKERKFAPQHSHGFDAVIACRKKVPEVFVATKFASLVERYSLRDGNLISTYYGPELFFPAYEIVQAGEYLTITYNEKTRWGFVNIHYSEELDRFFLVYSGKPFFNEKGIPAGNYQGRIIFVLNPEGKLEKEFELDRRIRIIYVKGDYLYGGSNNALFRFRI